MDCQLFAEFGRLVPCGFPEAAQWLQSTYREIEDGGRRPIIFNLWITILLLIHKLFDFTEIWYVGASRVRGGRTV